jgi:hypothetical protein
MSAFKTKEASIFHDEDDKMNNSGDFYQAEFGDEEFERLKALAKERDRVKNIPPPPMPANEVKPPKIAAPVKGSARSSSVTSSSRLPVVAKKFREDTKGGSPDRKASPAKAPPTKASPAGTKTQPAKKPEGERLQSPPPPEPEKESEEGDGQQPVKEEKAEEKP